MHLQGTPISQLLSARASETPARAAFIEGSGAGSTSWGSIARQAEELAAQIVPNSGDRRVGLVVDGATQFCATYLAALACGLCIAPLDPRATQEELGNQVTELELTDVLVDAPMAGLAGSLLGTGVQTWCVSEPGRSNGAGRSGPGAGRSNGGAGRSGPPWRLSATPTGLTTRQSGATPAARHRQPLDTAVVLRTSGSTGRPKLIPITQAQLLCGATQVATHHGLTEDDRGYCPLPLFHINAQVVGILSTLVSGASLVVDRRLPKDRFWDTVESSRATWLNLVPAILAVATDLFEAWLLGVGASRASELSSRVRFARSASSPLADPIRTRFETTTGISVLETYGMTEATGQITANPLRPEERRGGSVGLPAGVMLRVVEDEEPPTAAPRDADPRIAEPGQVGAVEISGPSVIDHYLAPGGMGAVLPARNPEGWLRTGDLAWRDADGFVYLVGRTDDVINRGGEKLYPAEIESILLRDPRVVGAGAVGRPHRSLGAEPVAFVVARPGGSAAENASLVEDLHRACAASLSFYKRPVEITVTDALPTGATGKLQRKALARELVDGACPR